VTTNDTVSQQNTRKRAAIEAVVTAKHAKAFFKAWSFLRSEIVESDNENEGLMHEGEAVTTKDPVVEQDNE
jgi:hypothetical protein